jgi:thymidylate synthase
MWQALDPPEGQYYLYIRNARNEDEERYAINRQWTYILRNFPKCQTAKRRVKMEPETVNVRLRTSWNMVVKHVNASIAWDEQRAIVEFKKLAGVQQSLGCKQRVENQEGERVSFQINKALTYTLAVAH